MRECNMGIVGRTVANAEERIQRIWINRGMERVQCNRIRVLYFRQRCDDSHACRCLLLIKLSTNSRSLRLILDCFYADPRQYWIHIYLL